ncbi:MAG: hypothetical protein WAS07_12745, partial [Micropruina sp.]
MSSFRLRGVALAVALGLSACTATPAPTPSSPSPSGPATVTPTISPTAAPEPGPAACSALAAGLSRREQVGQLLMLGTYSGSAAERALVSKYRLGSVILLGNSTAGVKSTAA